MDKRKGVDSVGCQDARISTCIKSSVPAGQNEPLSTDTLLGVKAAQLCKFQIGASDSTARIAMHATEARVKSGSRDIYDRARTALKDATPMLALVRLRTASRFARLGAIAGVRDPQQQSGKGGIARAGQIGAVPRKNLG